MLIIQVYNLLSVVIFDLRGCCSVFSFGLTVPCVEMSCSFTCIFKRKILVGLRFHCLNLM